MKRTTLLAALLLLAPGAPLAAQDDELPGYYQFFKKAGNLERLGPEAERDELIAQGGLIPSNLDGELPDLSLPDVDDMPTPLRSWVGEKHLVVVPFRTWW